MDVGYATGYMKPLKYLLPFLKLILLLLKPRLLHNLTPKIRACLEIGLQRHIAYLISSNYFSDWVLGILQIPSLAYCIFTVLLHLDVGGLVFCCN